MTESNMKAVSPETSDAIVRALRSEAVLAITLDAYAAHCDSINNSMLATLYRALRQQAGTLRVTPLVSATTLVGRSLANVMAAETRETDAITFATHARDAAEESGYVAVSTAYDIVLDIDVMHRLIMGHARRSLTMSYPVPTLAKPVAMPTVAVSEDPVFSEAILTDLCEAITQKAYLATLYQQYSQKAYDDGIPWLARLFATSAYVRTCVQIPLLGNLYGLARTDEMSNLHSAIDITDALSTMCLADSGMAAENGDTVASATLATCSKLARAHSDIISTMQLS